MTQSQDNRTASICDFHDLSDILCAVYRDSSYHFGISFLSEAMADGEYPDHLVDPPEHMKSGWTRTHEIPMVMHPEKGALILRRAELLDGEPPSAIAARIEEVHSEATSLEWKMRHELEQLEFWKDRPIVMGVAVVTRHECPRKLRPLSVDAELIIDRDKLPAFPTHIDAIFDHYTTDAALPVDKWGQELIDHITAPPEPLAMQFTKRQDLIRTYEEWDCELDGLVETADS